MQVEVYGDIERAIRTFAKKSSPILGELKTRRLFVTKAARRQRKQVMAARRKKRYEARREERGREW